MSILKFHGIEARNPTGIVGVKGIVKLEAIKYGKSIRDIEFENLITDYGLDQYGQGQGVNAGVSFFQASTSTAVPSNSDTTLPAPLGARFQQTGGSSSSPATSAADFSSTSWTATSAVGGVVGNVTKIGIFATASASSTDLVAVALVVDSSGNPVAFPVEADEQLRVTYTRRAYTISSESSGTQILSGVPYNYTIRAISNTGADVTNSISANNLFRLLPTATHPAWGQVSPSGSSPAASATQGLYTNGSYSRSQSPLWPAGNATGTWRGAIIASSSRHQYSVVYETPLVKTAGMILRLPFNFSWSRM